MRAHSWRVATEALARILAIAWNAALFGMKAVRFAGQRSSSNVGSLQSTGCSGEIKRNECGGDILREGQESINDMDNTASEVVILFAN